MSCVPICIQFELDTPDNLRKIVLTRQAPRELIHPRTGPSISRFGNEMIQCRPLKPSERSQSRPVRKISTGREQSPKTGSASAEVLKANRNGLATADDVEDQVVQIVRTE
jgi:hypothetical protein